MINKTILWDFDGVILDSMPMREFGFRKVLENFPQAQVDALIAFHLANGGWSRFVKFRYFYEEILKQPITNEGVQVLANQFSEIMKKELTNKANLIGQTVDFIEANHKNYNFHIVSGSEQDELRYLCKALDLDQYFSSIHGSPTPKTTLVQQVIANHQYKPSETCLIGDSYNDFEAADKNNITFLGFNNLELQSLGKYIYNFNEIIL